MDFNEIDLRLRAVEKQLKKFETYLRSPDFRTGRRIIAAMLLLAGSATLAYGGYRYFQLNGERSQRIDEALASNYPSYSSDYCRWVFDQRPGYDDCLRDEQKSFTKFEAAWRRNQVIGALREQMIGCFNGAQNESGISWKMASDCAELNNGLPEDGQPMHP